MKEYVFLLVWIFISYYLAYNRYNSYLCEFDNENKLFREAADTKFLRLAFVGIILFTGLRSYQVGADTIQYISNFLRTVNGTLIEGDMRFESGYRLYTRVIARFTSSAPIFLTITAVVTNFPIARLIKKYSDDKLTSVMLYITFGSFCFQLTGIRQAIALGICAVAIDYIYERKPIRFAALIVLATFFHKSAVLFSFAYLFGSKLINRKTVPLIAGGYAFVYSYGEIARRYAGVFGYENYSTDIEGSGGFVKITVLLFTLVLFYVLSILKINQHEFRESDQMFFCILLMGLFLFLARFQSHIMDRVSLYYRSLSIIILLPNVMKAFTAGTKRKGRIIVYSVFMICFIGLLFYHLNESTYLYTPFWKVQ